MEVSVNKKSSNNKLFYCILIGLALGIIVGLVVNKYCTITTAKEVANNIKLLGTIFIRLIQMIVAPLVFCTIVAGIAKMDDTKTVGRVGGKALLWFITASLVSLFIGLVWVDILKPGKLMNLDISSAKLDAALSGKNQSLTLTSFVEHVVPKSLFEALATNEILQILIFAVFFGIALSTLGKKGEALTHAFDTIGHIVLKMVTYIMWVAPFAVFGTISAVVAQHGLGVFKLYLYFFVAFLCGMVTLWSLMILVGYFVLGKRVFSLLGSIKNPLLIAFSTTSSEAVFPKLVEELENFGCNNKIVSFILPLGYSFNLDGSMMYMTFASIFVAQLYGIEMSVSQQIIMLLVLMITSKGIAGVPRASLIIIIATCSMFGIPPEGVALLIPIDHFCDMARSMTNVLGNALATTAVSKWENSLENPISKI